MLHDKNDYLQRALPVLILSFVVAGFLAFYTWNLARDHGTLAAAEAEQIKILANADKTKAQASALVKGIVDLSKSGNKNAEDILTELKKAGVNFQEPQAPAPAQAAK